MSGKKIYFLATLTVLSIPVLLTEWWWGFIVVGIVTIFVFSYWLGRVLPGILGNLAEALGNGIGMTLFGPGGPFAPDSPDGLGYAIGSLFSPNVIKPEKNVMPEG